MVVAPAVAPNVPTYATYTPYITSAEYLASATGVDSSQLVPGGDRSTNAAALATLIARASNYADNLCYQVLCATADLQTGQYRLQRDGTIIVPLDYTPIVEVTDVKCGYQAGQLQAMTDLSGLWFGKKTVKIPVSGATGPLSPGSGAMAMRGRLFAQVAYVNGFANTTIAAATAAASTLTVASALGIFPGLTLQLYDGASTEPVTVAASYVQGSTTVPLLAPLLFDHAAGAALSALPPAVKGAVVHLTSWMIKTRGATAIVLNRIGGQPAKQEQNADDGDEDYDAAVDALATFRRAA